jgi:phospholipid/cholesterol/gamma-HCH transport system substrate-binding protein
MRHFLLGLFLLFVLILFGIYTLFFTDTSLFGHSIRLTVELAEARGLRDGDSVQVSGVRLGRVEKIELDPTRARERRVTLGLLMEQEVVLRSDYLIEIADATVLGGRVVRIDPGSPEAPLLVLEPGESLRASLGQDPFQALSGLGSVGDSISQLVDELNAGGAGGNLTRTLENLSAATEDLKKIAADLAAGRGSLGAMLANTEFYDTWQGVGTDVRELLRQAREGEGLVAALLQDPDLRQRVDAAVASASEAFDNVAKLTRDDGSDSVAKVLLKDAEVAQQLRDISKNIQDVTGRLSRGEGALGQMLANTPEAQTGTLAKLMNSDELYVLARDILEDFRAVSAQISSGEGTLGQLIMEDGIAEQLNLALRTLTRSLEDYREAAPIATFTNVLFQAF